MASIISTLNLLILFGACVNVISPDPNVRLIPGPEKGQLEVLHDGQWGTVSDGCFGRMCDGSFTNQAASVVCRSLSQPSQNSYWVSGSSTGVDYLTTRLSRVICNGMEASLFDCRLTAAVNTTRVTHVLPSVVSIVCTDERMNTVIRYAGKPVPRDQTINIYENDYIYCDVETSNAKDFNCSIIAVEGTYYGTCPQFIFVEVYNLTRLMCSVSNWQMLNQDTSSVNINVMYPPQAFVSRELKVPEHTRVNLTLTNLPNPFPRVTIWRKTGTRLAWNQTEVFRIYTNISREDAGEFLVDISNTMNSSAQIQKQGHGLEIILLDVLYTTNQEDNCCNSGHCQTQLASMSSITFAMVGVTVVSLVSVLAMAVVVMKMRTTKERPVSPSVSDSATTTESVQSESDSETYVYWTPVS